VNPGILLVLDGWGIAPPARGNAITAAKTPCLDELARNSHVAVLAAAGEAVGLPAGTVGNSEIGHLVIGAGRPLEYDSLLVEREARAGRLAGHRALVGTCRDLAARGGTLHLVGLASDGRIHSDIAHFRELLLAAASAGLAEVAIHAITDGRDVASGTAAEYLRRLAGFTEEAGAGTIVSLIGRNFAMDKSGNAELTRQACELVLDATAARRCADLAAALIGLTDDDASLPALSIGPPGHPGRRVGAADAILFVNFRSDRTAPLANMVARRLAETGRSSVRLISLAQYDTEFPVTALVPRADAGGGLADAFSRSGVRSVRIAEREKFEHVTFFFNGRDSSSRPEERHVCVLTDREPDYVRTPQMNVSEVARAVISATTEPNIGLILANLANIDVVGHTGNYPATVKAVEAVDAAVGQIAAAARASGHWLIAVGDHGNGEQMVETGNGGADRPYGGHTMNQVPCMIAAPQASPDARTGARTLADVAPTVLELLGVPATDKMTGRPLLRVRPAS
jgi:2,3-bisphosphoglycerate-independent phosphoglycerate mutase